ncbi:GntR family transcriptional regulator [Devosia nitrariae]|uniref:Transcriptional regulator n=1 Tax=Devosia nitrariae TaxID=2071872 RepID=A0ABQ5W624_9HYPH|nr:GntR family transcriptional regulator [Devosia nitrariae]GLQ55422.1 transcriptional regulator [Devosia nitrariae]
MLSASGVRKVRGTAGNSDVPADNALNRQTAYRRFQDLLLSGDIRPGQSLSQRELMAKLGISLGALRELLARWEAEGLLAVMPQRGIQITTVDLRMIRESYQLRIAYEREATIYAVEHLSDDQLNAQRLLHTDILERANQGITGQLLDEAQRIDSGFHDFLIAATGNETMIQAYSINSIRVRMIHLDRIKLNPVVLAPALEDHLEIIDGILARDRERAVVAIERHLYNARQRAVAF